MTKTVPRRGPLATILGDGLLKLHEGALPQCLGASEIENLAQPLATTAGVPSGVVEGLVRLKEGVNRRAAARTGASATRGYATGYEAVVLAVGLSLQRGSHVVSTLLDTTDGGLIEAKLGTALVANPGNLSIEIDDRNEWIAVRMSADFEGRFSDGGASDRTLWTLFGDIEAYLTKVSPGWRPMAVQRNGEAASRPRLAELLAEIDEPTRTAWGFCLRAPGQVERYLQQSTMWRRAIGRDVDVRHDYAFDFPYAKVIAVLLPLLCEKSFISGKLRVPTGAADTGAGCRLRVRIDGGWRFKEAHIFLEVQDAGDRTTVKSLVDIVSQRVGEFGPFLLMEIESFAKESLKRQ